MNKSIKVLIVDDSELIRNLLTEILSQDKHIDVVGTATDPFDARAKIKEFNPDVLTLDIEMPRMDGITFLRNLIRLRPMPVVMISTLTEKGADITMEALQIGAVDFVAKPKLDIRSSLPALTQEINGKIRQAARANLNALEHNIHQKQLSKPLQPLPAEHPNRRIDMIAIGASTGGTEAIKEVLMTLPEEMPPILISQHMPSGFTRTFAERLNKLVKLEVCEFTADNEPLKPNHVYIANGDQHIVVARSGSSYRVCCDNSAPVNRHKPSVDVMFNSVASQAQGRAIGVLLTGMGIDGAAGMKAMKESGCSTIAQDEASSVVWGMPRVAVEQNAATDVLALNKIGKALIDQCYR